MRITQIQLTLDTGEVVTGYFSEYGWQQGGAVVETLGEMVQFWDALKYAAEDEIGISVLLGIHEHEYEEVSQEFINPVMETCSCGDEREHEHEWGKFERSSLAGTLHRKCLRGCPFVSLDGDEDEEGETEVETDHFLCDLDHSPDGTYDKNHDIWLEGAPLAGGESI